MSNKIQKPKWTPIELDVNLVRWENLMDETADHGYCDCNRCMECFGLEVLIDCFSEGEKAMAVNATNKLSEVK